MTTLPSGRTLEEVAADVENASVALTGARARKLVHLAAELRGEQAEPTPQEKRDAERAQARAEQAQHEAELAREAAESVARAAEEAASAAEAVAADLQVDTSTQQTGDSSLAS